LGIPVQRAFFKKSLWKKREEKGVESPGRGDLFFDDLKDKCSIPLLFPIDKLIRFFIF